MKQTISVIIISGNFEKVIRRCLDSVSFADEIIVVLANSTDSTCEIIKNEYPQIKTTTLTDEYNKNFSRWRNAGYKLVTSDWIMYVDTDEVVSNKLSQEILQTINQKKSENHYAIPRANHFLNKRVRHGGSYPDYVKRLFKAQDFRGYSGEVHEEPLISGGIGYLKNDLEHYTHTDLKSMLQKSIVWTDIEANLLYKSHHPPVVWWRFPRMMLTKFWERMIVQKMFLDGTVGWISVLFEVFNTFMIYARLWEIQKNKGI